MLRLLELPRKSDLVFQFLLLPENEISSIYYVHNYMFYKDLFFIFLLLYRAVLCVRERTLREGGGEREREKPPGHGKQ